MKVTWCREDEYAELLETLKGLVEYMRVDPEAVFANDKAFRRKCLNNWVVAAEKVIAKAEGRTA